ncbi:Por secretion system C-terminal sorting domain-containing protein [Hymenobacter daecheongensis DSM 21074]|uniref:Por secretion system C-terminal sorting domain-containing protein n=1 Tax=Hymenobacter daecheongensis DSM 21074 TaxID=1121955 RepID=A0A1M6IZN2_9BACT|nr:T9SS type A sorting domain-containing protein [Hymenobacter daecheongensis]SHJ39857.1 Por secretion system C-terminal sorting domain-containing protein [Hymenobacter daecheongensis DSM 21074]
MKTRFTKLFLAVIGLFGVHSAAQAQYEFKNVASGTSAGLGPYSQNFNGLAGSNAYFYSNTTLPGVYARFTLDSFGGQELESYQRLGTAAKLTPDDGREGTASAATVDADGTPHGAAWYHFGTTGSTDRALGGIASTSIAAGVGYIGVRLKNSSSVPIKNLEIKYAMEQWYNSSNTQQATMRVHYQRSSSAITQLTSGTWTPITALDVAAPSTSTAITPRDGNAATNRRVVQAKLLGGNGNSVILAPGEEIMVRWSYVFNSSSNGNGLSVDDIIITPETNIFYSKATGDLSDRSNWGTNTNGGGTAPASFALDNTVFYLRGTDSLASRATAAWAITGANSKLVLGTATEPAVLYVGSNDNISASIDVASGSRLRIAKAQNTLTLGTLNAKSVVEYLNSSATAVQTVNAGSYGILKLSGIGAKTVAGPVLISSDVAFTSTGLATLALNDYDLTILKNGRIRTLAGSALFVTNGKGGLRQTVSDDGQEVSFPVAVAADTADYTPVILSQSAANSEDTYKVRVANGVYRSYDANENGITPVTAGVVKKTWFISEEVIGNSDITLQTLWKGKDEATGFDVSNAYLDHYTTGSGWDRLPGPGSNKNSKKKSAKRSGVKKFSPFGVTSQSGGVLPVELVSFGAQRSGRTVSCRWSTASEMNNAYFTVERSLTNAQGFKQIGRVAGAGSSTQAHAYLFVDEQPATTVAYYRLRQVDYDGTESFSPVSVVAGTEQAAVSITPNPGSGRYEIRTSFSVPTYLHGSVVNTLGQHVLAIRQSVAAGSTQTPLDLSQQPAGLYIVRLSTPAGPVTLRVLKQ